MIVTGQTIILLKLKSCLKCELNDVNNDVEVSVARVLDQKIFLTPPSVELTNHILVSEF